jgi:nucleoside-triphosphatase
MGRRILMLTGSPGVGKTTILLRIAEALKAEGYKVGGMLSREVRERGDRVGFEILDLWDGRRGWLAHVNQESGPLVGRYRVNMEDLDAIGAYAILRATGECDVIAIDEIGPMELYSEKFKVAVQRAMVSAKLVVGVVHWKARDTLIEKLNSRKDTETYAVTNRNRGNLHIAVVREAVDFLAKHG